MAWMSAWVWIWVCPGNSNSSELLLDDGGLLVTVFSIDEMEKRKNEEAIQGGAYCLCIIAQMRELGALGILNMPPRR